MRTLERENLWCVVLLNNFIGRFYNIAMLKSTRICFSGDLLKVYNELGYTAAVSDVDFHPHDNIIAFCSFGQNHPVLLYQSKQTGW